MKRGIIKGQKTRISNYKHGLSNTRFWRIYYGIRQRCNNGKTPLYKWYGEKGIIIEWMHFQNFYEDMYNSYIKHIEEYGEKETSIDRINNNGNYCKENCRRATRKEQANNRKFGKRLPCIFIEYKGVKKSIKELSLELGISQGILYKSIKSG